MNVCIVTECGMTRTHGTGAQLLRLFAGEGPRFHHLYFWKCDFGVSECDNSYLLEDPYWPIKGQRLIRGARRLVGASWWHGDDVNTHKFSRLVRSRSLKPDVAFVVVGSEHQARRATSLLERLRIPYLLWIVDLEWDGVSSQALSREITPAFTALIESANGVLVLNEAIREEVLPYAATKVAVVPFCRETAVKISHAPEPGRPIRIVTTGRPYREGAQLLADSWPAIRDVMGRAGRKVELVYVGAHFDRLPEAIRSAAENLGYISDADYERVIAGCHLAYLTGPSRMDAFGRYSVPSRLSELLMAGLPLLACTPIGSATQKFLAELVPAAARLTQTTGNLVSAIEHFAASQQAWQAASTQAREFAAGHLALDAVRNRIIGSLSACTARPHSLDAAHATT